MRSRRPELEIKLAVPMQFEMPPLDTWATTDRMTELPPLRLAATYYDTEDLRLVRNGVTLRYRTGEGKGGIWTLKVPLGNDASVRDEIEMTGSSNRVPPEAYRLTTAFARGTALAPVARIRTQRLRWSLRDDNGEEVAELADDRVSVLDGRRIVERFREIEVESKGLNRAGLQRIASGLKSSGAVATSVMPKLSRALGPKVPPPEIPVAPEIGESDAVSTAFAAALADDVKRLMLYDPATRMGDEEGVHQMRVAIRRLRSHLRTFSTLVQPEWAQGLINSVRWLGRPLGNVRDLDVLRAHLREVTADLGEEAKPLFQELETRHAVAFEALISALSDARYVKLIESLLAAVSQPMFTSAADESCVDALPRLLAKEWQPLQKAADELKAGDQDQKYHRVRILAKEARYAAEAATPCLSGKLARQSLAFARLSEEIQQVLGRLQDDSMASEIVILTAQQRRRAGGFNFFAGRVIERLAQSSAASKQKFHQLWEASSRKMSRKWLKRT